MTYEELTKAAEKAPLAEEPNRTSAVLVPVIQEGEMLSLLFEVRSDDLPAQPGEVCFPGGGVEEGETPAQAALRETVEELGIPESLVEVGLPLPPHKRGSTAVYPFLGRLLPGWKEALFPQKSEVKEIFTVPLDFFLNNEAEVFTCRQVTIPGEDFPAARLGFPNGYPWGEGRMEVPLWMWEDKPIWGLTARIVRELVEKL